MEAEVGPDGPELIISVLQVQILLLIQGHDYIL